MPNFEIQVQYLQTALESFSSFRFPVAIITWKKWVMVLNCFVALVKEDLAFFNKDLCAGVLAEHIDNIPINKVILIICDRGVNRMHWFSLSTFDLYSSNYLNIFFV